MDKKILVAHQLPGEKPHALGQLCDMNEWGRPLQDIEN